MKTHYLYLLIILLHILFFIILFRDMEEAVQCIAVDDNVASLKTISFRLYSNIYILGGITTTFFISLFKLVHSWPDKALTLENRYGKKIAARMQEEAYKHLYGKSSE